MHCSEGVRILNNCRWRSTPHSVVFIQTGGHAPLLTTATNHSCTICPGEHLALRCFAVHIDLCLSVVSQPSQSDMSQTVTSVEKASRKLNNFAEHNSFKDILGVVANLLFALFFVTYYNFSIKESSHSHRKGCLWNASPFNLSCLFS